MEIKGSTGSTGSMASRSKICQLRYLCAARLPHISRSIRIYGLTLKSHVMMKIKQYLQWSIEAAKSKKISIKAVMNVEFATMRTLSGETKSGTAILVSLSTTMIALVAWPSLLLESSI